MDGLSTYLSDPSAENLFAFLDEHDGKTVDLDLYFFSYETTPFEHELNGKIVIGFAEAEGERPLLHLLVSPRGIRAQQDGFWVPVIGTFTVSKSGPDVSLELVNRRQPLPTEDAEFCDSQGDTETLLKPAESFIAHPEKYAQFHKPFATAPKFWWGLKETYAAAAAGGPWGDAIAQACDAFSTDGLGEAG